MQISYGTYKMRSKFSMRSNVRCFYSMKNLPKHQLLSVRLFVPFRLEVKKELEIRILLFS